VDLSWNPPTGSSDPAVAYNVYRVSSGGVFALLNSSPILLPSWTDTTAQAGLTYDYQVTSVDALGVESEPSGMIVVSIP
jgi:fibronectin type 3 domain-containing protein